MKKFFVLLLAVAAIVFTMSGCSAVVDSLKTGVSRIINGGIGEYAEEFKNIVTLSGDVIEESIVPEDGKEITSVVLEGVAFNAVENGTAFIRIVPSDENKVELKYQSDLPEHGFYKIAENGEFKITAKRGTQFRTACFEVTVYSECELKVLRITSTPCLLRKSARNFSSLSPRNVSIKYFLQES